jgi:hypothetical protein
VKVARKELNVCTVDDRREEEKRGSGEERRGTKARQRRTF